MEPFLGQIQAFGFNFAPRGWALCQGQILPIAQYNALFSLLGTTFGGDGRSTFGLPDLRSRSIVGVGNGPGLDHISWGERGGAYMTYLTQASMPSHSHVEQIAVNDQDGATGDDPNNAFIGNPGTFAFNAAPSSGAFLGAGITAKTGGSQPFNSRNPYLGIYVSIAIQGLYPSRN
ncbi:MAG: microcystin-dependent protein [Crocinitomicaceae bacterium]|jgi:microcystin-dependent protein